MGNALIPPSGLSALAVSSSSIKLAWVNSTSVFDTTIVWRSDATTGPWQSIADLSRTETEFLDDGLPAGTTFFYRLSVQKRKRYSDFSGIVFTTTLPVSSGNVVESLVAPGNIMSRIQVPYEGGTEIFIFQDPITFKHIARFLSADGTFIDRIGGFGWNYALAVAYDSVSRKLVTMTLDTQVSKGVLRVDGGPTYQFGDVNSLPGGMIRLKSGGFVGIWAQRNAGGGVGLAYLSPSGVFSTKITSFPEDFNVAGTQSVIVQHPTDGSIWGFISRDGTGVIRAIRARESQDTISIDLAQRGFFGGVSPENSPEHEFPHIEVFPDSSRGVIHVAFQSQHSGVFSVSPFVKGAWVCVASVKADTTKTFSVYPNYIERASVFGFVANSQGSFLAVNPLDQGTLTYPNLHIVPLSTPTVSLYTRKSVRVVSSLKGNGWFTDDSISGKTTKIQLS